MPAMNLEMLGVEARHELARLRPMWKCSVQVNQGMSYTLGRANEDDPRFDPIHVSVGATAPITPQVIEKMKQDLAREVVEREKREATLLRR